MGPYQKRGPVEDALDRYLEISTMKKSLNMKKVEHCHYVFDRKEGVSNRDYGILARGENQGRGCTVLPKGNKVHVHLWSHNG